MDAELLDGADDAEDELSAQVAGGASPEAGADSVTEGSVEKPEEDGTLD